MTRYYLTPLIMLFIFNIHAMTIEFQSHHSRSLLKVDKENKGFTYQSENKLTKYQSNEKNIVFFKEQINRIVGNSKNKCTESSMEMTVVTDLEKKPVKVCSPNLSKQIARQVMLLKLSSNKISP